MFIVRMTKSIFVVFNMKLFFFILKILTITPLLKLKNVIMSSIGTHKKNCGTHIRKLELITQIRTD